MGSCCWRSDRGLPEPPLPQRGFWLTRWRLEGVLSPTHSLGAPEAVCQAWAPQGTADRKPFPHPSSIACQGPRRSSRLCPGGRCSLLTASPCSWTPLNLSYPFFHSRCPCMVQAPGPLACASDARRRTRSQAQWRLLQYSSSASGTGTGAYEDPTLKLVPRTYVASSVLSIPGPSQRAIQRSLN